MIYYAVLYMKNGEIHLKPWSSEEKAQKCIDRLLQEEEWKDLIKTTKIVKKDTSTALWQRTNGLWIGA